MAKSIDPNIFELLQHMRAALSEDIHPQSTSKKKKSSVTGPRRYLQLKVTLKEISPPIWRRFIVPNDFSLAQLHDCLQFIMGWGNCHLYEFIVGGRRDGTRYSAPIEDEFGYSGAYLDDFDDEDAHDCDLSFLIRKGIKFRYVYDMGDSWEHEIVVENANYDHTGDPPVLVLAGKRNCPPEDCGGSWGYANLLEALADKKHPEHKDMKEWVGDVDPEEFSAEDCNVRLESRYGAPKTKAPKKTAKKAVKKATKKITKKATKKKSIE